MKRLLITIGIITAIPGTTQAVPGVENYPKVLAYTSAVNLLPESVQDTLSWYDVLVCMERPATIQGLRERNPDQRYLWMAMPQHVEAFEGDSAWWMPDTLWSFKRLASVYAYKNDWYLRDTTGEIITDGNHMILNWTAHCPVGTFGSSKGMRAAEWIASRALSDIALSGRYWEPWSWDSRTAYNGFMFEILVDCLGSYGWQLYANADPDRDGIAEGVYHTCSTGGNEDPLSVLFRAENEIFYEILDETFPDDFVFTINENSHYLGPWWRTRLSGMKLENWMRGCCPTWADWWDYFYGITPPYDPQNNWGAGYLWTEWAFDKPVEDHLKGWDVSWIQTWEESRLTREENLRQMRFGLGTAMLGDGYFCYTRDQRMPEWQPEFNWDFGLPLGDFSRETMGSDTLYVRAFTRGMVEVNPAQTPLLDVPPEDTRFTLWLPVVDLGAQSLGEEAIRVTWTAPDGEHNEADSYELRYGTEPLSTENWESATSYAGNPIYATPGSPVAIDVAGLANGTTYHFAVRTWTRGRPEPVLSNPAEATTSIFLDTTPPGVVEDVTLITAGSNHVHLGWIASGDDGGQGIATRTRLRYRVGSAIQSEDDWSSSVPVNLPDPPPPAGVADDFRVSGLSGGTLYGFAVRMEDEAGNLGPLSAPFTARTLDAPPPPVDTTPPADIHDLEAITGASGAVDLRWTAPGDDGMIGRAASYEIRSLMGRAIESEADWAEAALAPPPLPDPAVAGAMESFRVEGLKPGAMYGFAVRSTDEVGNRSGLSNPITAEAGEESPPPPHLDEEAPAAVVDLAVTAVSENTADLAWTAPGDDGDLGTAERYELRLLQGRPIETEIDWGIAVPLTDTAMVHPAAAGTPQSYTLRALRAGTRYGVALRARDEAGNIGPLNPPLAFTTAEVLPPSPPATIVDLHLIHAGLDSARIGWTAPGDDGMSGAATSYHARLRPSIAIESEEDWAESAVPDTTGMPRPSIAGTLEEWTVRGLLPGTRYCLAIRAQDDSSLFGGLPSPFFFDTAQEPPPPPPPLPPPDPIRDLVLVRADSTGCDLRWTSPGVGETEESAARILLAIREGGEPIVTEEDWAAAELWDGALPIPSAPGSLDSLRLEPLEPGGSYALALRAENREGLLGALGNSIVAVLPEIPVETPDPPPAAILDLAATALAPDSLELRWTAVGEDSLEGSASAYLLRILAGEPIDTPEDWERAADSAESLAAPQPAGSPERAILGGLIPGSSYGLAIRARDAAGQLSAFAAGAWVTMPAPEEPPDTVETIAPPEDLTIVAVEETAVSLEFRHPLGFGDSGGPARFEAALATIPLDDSTWSSATIHPEPPAPGGAGEGRSIRWERLEAGSVYWAAVRAIGPAGQVSPLSNVVRFETPALDLAPPQKPTGVRCEGLGDGGGVRLSWEPSPDPDLAGYFVDLAFVDGVWSRWNEAPIPAGVHEIEIHSSAIAYAVAAVDVSGNESDRVEATPSGGGALRLEGPFPHPVTTHCRFEVDLPPGTPVEEIELTLRDIEGRVVWQLDGQQAGTIGGPMTIQWDRRDRSGRSAAPGFYLLTIEAGAERIQRRIFLAP